MTTFDPSTAEALDKALTESILALDDVDGTGPDGQSVDELWEYFRAQCLSRHLDLLARRLRRDGIGYYSIGSAGHEANAALALATRPTDPALLHYRSGAFYIARNRRFGAPTDPVDDVIAGMLAHSDEPIAGGRHKVFGHPGTGVIPQTSTIASHLPRAMGVAMTIGRSAKIESDLVWPDDAVVVCSFGDASANHSTALGAINAISHLAYQQLPVPIVLVCEDNGWGISVRTPPGWIEASFGDRPGLDYRAVDGSDADEAISVCRAVVDQVRAERRPTFLHLRTVRFLGHAGTDVERGYRSIDDIRAAFELDPILGTARALHRSGVDASEIVSVYEQCRAHVDGVADRRRGSGRELGSAAEVMAPLATDPPADIGGVEAIPTSGDTGVTLAQGINSGLVAELGRRPGAMVFGEDVALKGGVYGVTKGLRTTFGAARVFDTVLDEQSILGVALGAAVSGLLPIPEIEYLAYLHNAADQIRGEAATLKFFSGGTYRNGMVVRIAGFGYQKGFGGHFHNDDAIAALRDIPDIVVGTPARAADAAGMLAGLCDAAEAEGTVGVMIEPIALYHRADLHHTDDGAWRESLGDGPIAPGAIRRYGADDPDVTILTWGNGLWMSLRAAARHPERRCQVIDIRWLAPLPIASIMATRPRRVLIADETRRRGGVGEGLVAELLDAGFDGRISRVASKDSFVPLGAAAELVLLSEAEIEAALLGL